MYISLVMNLRMYQEQENDSGYHRAVWSKTCGLHLLNYLIFATLGEINPRSESLPASSTEGFSNTAKARCQLEG